MTPATTRSPHAKPSKPAAQTESSDGLQTLHRALTILELFSDSRDEWTASEVSSELDLSLATTSRFMRGLESRGYLLRNSTRGYRLGISAIELGRRAVHALPMRSMVRPVTAKLARDSGETAVALTLVDTYDGALVVDRAESNTSIHLSVAIGEVLPLYSGIARTLLAYLPEEDWALMAKLGRRPELPAELADIRKRGYCESFEGVDAGTWGVAAPVLSPAGGPTLAIGIIAPLARHDAKIMKRTTALVLAATSEMRKKLSY